MKVLLASLIFVFILTTSCALWIENQTSPVSQNEIDQAYRNCAELKLPDDFQKLSEDRIQKRHLILFSAWYETSMSWDQLSAYFQSTVESEYWKVIDESDSVMGNLRMKNHQFEISIEMLKEQWRSKNKVGISCGYNTMLPKN